MILRPDLSLSVQTSLSNIILNQIRSKSNDRKIRGIAIIEVLHIATVIGASTIMELTNDLLMKYPIFH